MKQEKLEKYSERFDNDKSEIGNPDTWGKRVVEEPKQYFYCSDRLELDENERCVTQCDHCAVIQPKYTIGCDPYDKQETLEEAAEILYPVNNTGSMFMANRDELNNSLKQEGFIEGAKWQAERSYSEEEVIKLLISCKNRFGGSGLEDYTSDSEIIEWFEQFKNK